MSGYSESRYQGTPNLAAPPYALPPAQGRTVPDVTQYLRNNAVFNVKDYGAVGDGVADDTAAFLRCAAACAAVGGAYVFYIPANNISGQYYLISDEIVFPIHNGMCIRGDGSYASQIAQATAGKRGFVVDATVGGLNGALFTGFGISSTDNNAPTATVSFYLKSCSRSKFIDVKADSGTVAGFHIINCAIMEFVVCEATYCAIGLLAETGGISGMNASSLTGCNFELNAIGMQIQDGASGIVFDGCCFESNTVRGLHFVYACRAIGIYACYFEHNFDGVNPSEDILIGDASFCQNIDIRGTYFNGRPIGGTYDYVPIRLGFVQDSSIEDNYINTGNTFVKCIVPAFSSSSGVKIRNNGFGSTVDVTDGSTLYVIPRRFAYNGNEIVDRLFTPPNGGNFLVGDMPTAPIPHITGASTWAKGAVLFAGRQAVASLISGAPGNPYLEFDIPISATNNQQLRGRFVTFAVPVLANTNGADLLFEVDFGSGAPNAVIQYNPLSLAVGWDIYTITVWVPVAETSLTFYIQATVLGSELMLGKAVGYIGVHQALESTYSVGEPYWAAAAMPTTGTWTIGDFVKNTAPAVAGLATAQYIIKGWERITTGAGNVLNTDWVECRELTGT